MTAGYDFLADGSIEVESALNANFGSSDALINETWDRNDLVDALRLGNPNQIEIGSLNAHYDHNRALPALGNATGDETNLFTVDDIAGFGLDRSLYFTMGCHAGLSVADIAVGVFDDNDSDWAQTYASQGALYAANTGYGYGDTVAVALSERLMAQFAERLDGSMTVGQAMTFAKQQYFGNLGLYGVYDEKALQEATFYGLPMYKVGTSTPPAPVPVTTVEDPVTGLQSAPVSFSPSITQQSTPIGEFFSVDGEAQFVHFRPLQPIVRTDVTPADGDLLARGALITGLITTDIPNVDIAYGRPIIDLSALEPEVESDEIVFPTTFATVSVFNTPPSSPAGPSVAQRQQLNVIAGQFTSPADGSTQGTQRLFTDFDATVYYSDSNGPSDDFTKPTFNQIQAALIDGQASFIVEVSDDGDTGPLTNVVRVVALYRQSASGTDSTWVSVDLVHGSPWTGGGPIDPSALVDGKLDYMIQAIDSSGNIAVSTFKGLFHKAEELPPPPADAGGYNIEIGGSLGENGWYTSAVTLTVTAQSGEPGDPEVTIDGALASGSNTYQITQDGAHVVTVEGVGFGVLIDKTRPTITIDVPANGAEYEVGDVLAATYFCLDAGSGIVSCDGPTTSGSLLDTSSLGEFDFTVATEDHAGWDDSLNHSYGVYGIDGPTDPVPLGTTINVTGFVPNAISGATWNWGDSSSDSGVVSDREITGSHTYSEPGVFLVTLDADGQIYEFEFVVVYDPVGVSVTGTAQFDWPDTAFPGFSGKGKAGMSVKYKKRSLVPTGNFKFEFTPDDKPAFVAAHSWLTLAGNKVKFDSDGFDWLLVLDGEAWYLGTGTFHKDDDPFRFWVHVIDGGRGGGKGDLVRVMIYDHASGVVFDTQVGDAIWADPTTPTSTGNLKVKN